MREITFAIGNEQHLKDCRDALCQSTLGERNGYQQVGEIPNLYRPGVKEYLMVKDLKKCLSYTM